MNNQPSTRLSWETYDGTIAGRSLYLMTSSRLCYWQALQEPPEDGGLWSGPKVARWMSELLQRFSDQ